MRRLQFGAKEEWGDENWNDVKSGVECRLRKGMWGKMMDTCGNGSWSESCDEKCDGKKAAGVWVKWAVSEE
jgi:hypothetical protein